MKEKILNAQLEIIEGYINKIEMNNLTIEEVKALLWADREYLEQEFALLTAEKYLGIQ